MKLLVTTALLALAAPLAAGAQTVSAPIRTALADPARPAADKERDAARHPGEIVSMLKVKPGGKVADFVMGGGYWTRILSPLVGPKGHVYGFQPAEFSKAKPGDPTLADEYKNVSVGVAPFADVSFAEPLDAIVTVQNWHDLHLARFAPTLGKTVAGKLFAALKPGGVLLVVDHVAAADPGFAVPDNLHRIDPAAARAEIESAGFKFDGSLPILANPADPHTAKVFDPSIRGKTDQFVYRFRKPG